MSFVSWLRLTARLRKPQASKPIHRADARSRRPSLQLEALEDRATPGSVMAAAEIYPSALPTVSGSTATAQTTQPPLTPGTTVSTTPPSGGSPPFVPSVGSGEQPQAGQQASDLDTNPLEAPEPDPIEPTLSGDFGDAPNFYQPPANGAGADNSSPPQTPSEVPQSGQDSTPPPAGGSGSTPADLTGGGPTASVPPVTPAVPTTTITEGNYDRHYTRTGKSSSSEFFVDVKVHSTLSGGATGLTESGTVTYTTWLKNLGQFVVQFSNVTIPFGQTVGATIAGSSPYGLTVGGSGVPGYDWTNFGYATLTWDTLTWSDSVSYTSSGFYRPAAGLSFAFRNDTAWDNRWSSTRSATADAVGPGGVVKYDTTFDGSYQTGWSMSDRGGNVASSAGPVDSSGRPANFSAPTAEGTKYFERSFDAGSYQGTNTVAYTLADPQTVTNVATKYHLGYAGVDGYRYFNKDEVTVASPPGAATATSNTINWLTDVQRTGTYGGSQDSDFSDVSSLTPVGSVTVSTNRTDTVAVARSEYKNDYLRDDGTTRVSGLYSVTQANTQPLVTKSEETRRTVYGQSSLTQPPVSGNQPQLPLQTPRVTDTFTYRYESGGGSQVTTVDSSNYAVTVSGWTGSQIGRASGGRFSTGTASSQGSQVISGTWDILTGTGAANNTGNYSGSASLIDFSSDRYQAEDGSVKRDAYSFIRGSSNSSGNSSLVGNFDSEGRQIDGTSYDHSESTDGIDTAWSWVQLQIKDSPTQTAFATGKARSTFNGTTDLNFAGPDIPSGTVKIDASSSIEQDVTTTLKGTQKIFDTSSLVGIVGGLLGAPVQVASLDVDDWQHQTTNESTSAGVDLSLSAGLPYGTVTNKDTEKGSYDFVLDRTLAKTNGSARIKTDANGSGSLEVSDTVTTAIAADAATPSRTFSVKRTADATTAISGSGTLADAAGYTGKWRYNSSADVSVNDQVTSDYAWENNAWKETSRTFSINRDGGSGWKFHQEDNGLGRGSYSGNGIGGSASHTLDIDVWSREKVVENGSPNNFTFTRNKSSRAARDEAASGSWSNSNWGEGGSFSNEAHTVNADRDNRTGTSADGKETYSLIDTYKFIHNRSRQDSSNYSPRVENESHFQNTYTMTETRLGNSQQGTGNRVTYGRSTSSWQSRDKTTGNVSKGGNPDAKPYSTQENLSWPGRIPTVPEQSLWGAFYEGLDDGAVMVSNWLMLGQIDYLREAGSRLGDQYYGGTWLYENGADVVRIVGGVIDVGIGAGITLGSAGIGIIPGVVLMGVGIDQIITGVENIRTGQRAPSVVEYGGYSAARELGYSEQTSQIVGALTPAVASLGLTFGPALVSRTVGVGRAVASPIWATTDWLGKIELGIFGRQATGTFKAFMDAHEAVHVWLVPARWLGTNGLGKILSFPKQLLYVASPTFRWLEEAAAQTHAIWKVLGFRYKDANLITHLFINSRGEEVLVRLARGFRLADSGTAPVQGLLFPFRTADRYVSIGAIAAEWGIYGGAAYWFFGRAQP